MPTTKPAHQSLTLWACMAAIVIALLRQFGVEVGAGDEARIYDIATNAGELIALVLVLWGRFRAKARIAVDGVTRAPMAGVAVACVLAATSTACTPISDGIGRRLAENPQDWAGINGVNVQFSGDTGNPLSVEVRAGKESAQVDVAVRVFDENGYIRQEWVYGGQDVRAFEGQEFRAQLAAAISANARDAGVEIVPDVIDRIVDAIMATVGGGVSVAPAVLPAGME